MVGNSCRSFQSHQQTTTEMPVRMKKDPEKRSGRDNYPGKGRRTNAGGGGSNPIVYLIPLLMKKPKLLIVVVILGTLWYFFGGNCNGIEGGNITQDVVKNLFSTGLEYSQEKHEETAIYEPLADNIKNPLPESFSLTPYAPKRLNQGKQGSCVAWAASYAARTILESRKTGVDPNQVAFSPSYLYNQIALTNCQGSYLPDAMKNLQQGGVLPFNDFGYDEGSCSEKPDSRDRQKAKEYTIHGFQRLSKSGNVKEVDMLAIKQHLSQGAPVVIGMMVGGSFMRTMNGQKVWLPSSQDYDQRNFGGHAMCVVGYDDYLEGGAFEIMNSWGDNWGDDGIAYVRYKDFDYFVREAYGIDPMGNADAPNGTVLNAKVALKLNKGGYVGLRQGTQGLFGTLSTLPSGTEFKVEVTNDLPCYIYVFGEETDGSSYVLFPYTEKHSPYCGVTGTRLFPSDYSMVTDDLGNRDHIAVVLSKDPIDYNVFNQRMTEAGGSYANRLQTVLGRQNAEFSGGENISVVVDFRETSAVGTVISIDKK